MIDNFKDWYKNKKGKYILFFGFYIIFFIFLAIYLRSIPKEDKKEEKTPTQEEKITTYDITNLTNNNYSYKIIVNDNNEITNYNGTKDNIDYANFDNKYFLDIYNINQLLKKSKYIDSKDKVLSFELTNAEINDILLTNKPDGLNKIDVMVNDKKEVVKVNFDLTNYMEKNIYQINISYTLGEENENSAS